MCVAQCTLNDKIIFASIIIVLSDGCCTELSSAMPVTDSKNTRVCKDNNSKEYTSHNTHLKMKLIIFVMTVILLHKTWT